MINFNNIVSAANKVVGHASTAVKMHAPTIMIVAGVAVGIGAAVLACKATSKVNDIEYEAMKEIDELDPDGDVNHDYDVDKDVSKIKIKKWARIVKAYTPSIVAGIISIALIFGSHSIMKKRCAALVTAYNALSTTLTTFYNNVKNELGEEKTNDIFQKSNAMTTDALYNSIVEADEACNPKTGTGYWTYFDDETSKDYRGDYSHDYVFLKAQEMFATDRLKSHGVVTLNEVYEALGMSPTNQGFVIGWSRKNGDEYVDFGLTKPVNKVWNDSKGLNGKCVLEFNTRGIIYGSIDD